MRNKVRKYLLLFLTMLCSLTMSAEVFEEVASSEDSMAMAATAAEQPVETAAAEPTTAPTVEQVLSEVKQQRATEAAKATTDATVHFPVGSSTISRSFSDNDAALSAIAKAIENHSNAPQKKIYRIVIKGFTSPEGSNALNERLARARMQSLQSYLEREGIAKDLPIEIASGGEDWESVRQFLEKSEIAEKAAILNLIQGIAHPDRRLAQLKQRFPKVYHILQKQLFPTLRRTEIHLETNGESVADQKQNITTTTYPSDGIGKNDISNAGSRKCVEVRFKVNSSDLQSNPQNKEQLKQMADFIENIKGRADITSITLCGYASPDGSVAYNNSLSQARMESLRRYLVAEGVAQGITINATSGGENWTDLRSFVESSSYADRDAILDIIDSNQHPDRKLEQIKRRFPKAYRDMHDRIFPELRRTEMCIGYRQKTPIPSTPKVEETKPVEVQETPIPSEEPVQEILEEREPQAIVALKTNLLYDAALWPNAEIERWFGKNRQWSVMAEWGSPWYVWHHNSRAYEILNVGVEGRYWLNAKSPDHRWLTGWFAGAYVMSGKYDIEWNSKGYQGEYWSPGLTFGYAHRIGKWWNMEYSVGVGYLGTRWRRYYGMFDDRHLIWQFNGNTDYVGPTKRKSSLRQSAESRFQPSNW